MVQKKKSQSTKKHFWIFFVIISLIVLSKMVTIYIHDAVEEKQFKVKNLLERINSLKYKNDLLLLQIYHYEAFTTIASEAVTLGFKQTNELYLIK